MEYQKKKIFNTNIVARTSEEIQGVLNALCFASSREKKLSAYLKKISAILVYSKKTGYDNLLFPKEGIYVCQTRTVLDATREYLASLFVHEARHLWQFKKKKPYYGDIAEEDAYHFQRRFLKKYGIIEDVEWLDELYKQKWWVFKDKKSGKRKSVSPRDRIFKKFVERYVSGNLF